MPQTNTDPQAFDRHDHGSCVSEAMAFARQVCTTRDLRLTPVRARVLEMLLESHRALGAYDLLERIAREGLGSQPPVIYRALEFLVANGFVHRIERLNAFVACHCPGRAHQPAFMICRQCTRVAEAEISATRDALGASARKAGFDVERSTHEVEGLCPACQKDPQV